MKRLTRNEIFFFIAAVLPAETYIRLLVVGIPILAYCVWYIIKEVQAELLRREQEAEETEIEFPDNYGNSIKVIGRLKNE